MPKLWLMGGGAFVVVLVIFSIVIAFTGRTDPLPDGSPERTVQLFLVAAEDEEFAIAYDLFAKKLKDECSLEKFAQAHPDGTGDLRDSRVRYVGSKILNGSRLVDAKVTQLSNSGPFGASEYSENHRYILVREEGEWRISRYTWPQHPCNVSE